MAITAFALSLAVPLWAQHGGGHGGGHAASFAGRAGFSGGHMGAGHFSGGFHAGSGLAHRSSRAGFTRGSSLHNGFRRGHRDDSFRFRSYGFRNNCYGYGCRGTYGYPWWGYYDPWWWWDSGSSYDEDYERNRQIASEMNQQSLAEQQMLRQEETEGDRDVYAHSAPQPSAAPETEGPQPATVLVFRDQHKQEVQNYAIVGQTLWAFSGHRTARIPLSDLDLTATAETNDERGLSFRIPAATQAQ